MFKKFAISAVNSGRLQNLIKPNVQPHPMQLRKTETFHLPKCRTERFRNSVVNSIIRSLNEGDNFKIDYVDDVLH